MVTNPDPVLLPFKIIASVSVMLLSLLRRAQLQIGEPLAGPADLYVPGEMSVPTTYVPSAVMVVAGPAGTGGSLEVGVGASAVAVMVTNCVCVTVVVLEALIDPPAHDESARLTDILTMTMTSERIPLMPRSVAETDDTVGPLGTRRRGVQRPSRFTPGVR
jgi:hypothetical protein